MSERVLKTLACRGLRVGPSKSRLSFLLQNPRVSEGFLKGSLKGSLKGRVLDGFLKGSPSRTLRKPFKKVSKIDDALGFPGL